MSEVRTWNTMIKAIRCAGNDASMTEGLQKLLAKTQEAFPILDPAPQAATVPQPANNITFPGPSGENVAGGPSPTEADGEANQSGAVPQPRPLEAEAGLSQGITVEGKVKSKIEPLPGSMAALGFTCQPKNLADGITSRLGRGGRGGKRREVSLERLDAGPGTDIIGNGIEGHSPLVVPGQQEAVL